MEAESAQTPSDTYSVLFVDDEQQLHRVIERLLERRGISVTSCLNAKQAVEALQQRPFDLVLTDLAMPGMDGLELFGHIRKNYPSVRVVMITAHASVQHAVGAMRKGIADYIPKPFSTTELADRIEQHLEEREEEQERRRASAEEQQATEPAASSSTDTSSTAGSDETDDADWTSAYVGEHPSIKELKELLPRVAQNRAPVFIYGESGTGKEILARLIHEGSPRSDQPYVTINCANLPRELVESHLFGHRKGAFTGAVENMEGAFERADGGTLLLDEITEVELPVQAKLLRVLQEQEFQKVGEPKTRKVNVRVIATSNRDLEASVQEGDFREDLYHRLAVFPLHVPPLRGRISDIPLLAEHFVAKYCDLYEIPPKEIDSALIKRFQVYSWPGNVRQLENMVHRGVVLAAGSDSIAPKDIFSDFFVDTQESEGTPSQMDMPAGEGDEGQPTTIEEMERRMILQALAEEDANQQVAAERLGISARTIRNKLKKYRKEGFSV